ncbi:vancomycin resistance protein YoaR [Saccharothrix saharensis]|uniref:Vancomycin resistance protein YoaR n=1 Tax=Saccharothrix saharensis TaxID=571190 RepID=A0A543JGY1_9PSEU|nr:VanW family protein [Saccharothrix saharensis]TQM82090.1 vancomycin resistance protein YoaR [Saccharothrix saharensis]
MPENQRPEYDAERTKAMEPVRPSGTASERTTKITAGSAAEAEWPQEEPDTEPDTREDSSATVRNVTPPSTAGDNATAPPSVSPHVTQQHPPRNAQQNPSRGPDATQAIPPAGDRTRALAPPPSAERTQMINTPPGGFDRPPSPSEATTVFAAPVSVPPGPEPQATVHGPVMVDGDEAADEADARRKRLRKGGLIAAAVLGVLVVLYGLDLVISGGDVPRGVTVAGVDVGGLSRPDAEQKLRDEIGPRLAAPVKARAGDVETAVDPKAAGLELDWTATLDRAGSQPLSPVTRITSFFTSREVGFATAGDPGKLTAALEALRAETDHDPAEGTIRFEGATPVAVDPKQGQKLDVPGATDKLLADWADGGTVELPVATTPVKTTKEGVAKALEEVAKPATAAPLIIQGEGKDATLTPEQLATVLVFEPADDGSLTAKVDNGKVVEHAGPQLKDTEKEGKDAQIVFEGGRPVVKESVDGLGIDWDKSLATALEVLKRDNERAIKAEYKHTPAKVTTEQANKMGIKEVIGEFQTGGFVAASGTNIRVVAEKVNGAIVKPGETFSLNGYTGPRGTAQGYVEAGIIENGVPGKAVGGGISQFATTLYNAAYHAGMKDAGHKEHSYWISRYPKGREATVFMDGAGNSLIDIKFTNPDETGVAIQTIWTPSSIKIVLWGTKNYDVTGSTSAEFNHTQPQERKVDKPDCQASAGSPGFSVTDTRTITDRRTGQSRQESRTVRYDPQYKIVCEPPPPGG